MDEEAKTIRFVDILGRESPRKIFRFILRHLLVEI